MSRAPKIRAVSQRQRPPFPYPGGKRRWAAEVWRAFGKDCIVYSEPFMGGGAVLLLNPKPCAREVCGDRSPQIVNFWRAVKHDPEAVAFHADLPTSQFELTARGRIDWAWSQDAAERLAADEGHYDAQRAGVWAWGQSNSIGLDFGLRGQDKVPAATSGRHASAGGGVGVRQQAGQVPSVALQSPAGRGVQQHTGEVPRVNHECANSGQGLQQQADAGMAPGKGPMPFDGFRLLPWILWLHHRLRRVIVLCGDWTSCVTPTYLVHNDERQRPAAVFLDPPYKTAKQMKSKYGIADAEADDVATAAYQWAVRQADDPRFRIAFCCHEGDFPLPDGWTAQTDEFKGIRRADRRAANRDCVMFSPACFPQGHGPEQGGLF